MSLAWLNVIVLIIVPDIVKYNQLTLQTGSQVGAMVGEDGNPFPLSCNYTYKFNYPGNFPQNSRGNKAQNKKKSHQIAYPI